MSIDIKAPTFPESVQDGTIATWHKNPGDTVARDEHLVDIETDKVVIEIVSPAAGVLSHVLKVTGDTVLSGEKLAEISAVDVGASTAVPPPSATVKSPAVPAKPEVPVAGPAARKLARESGVSLDQVTGTGKGGRVMKEDLVHQSQVTPVASPGASPAVSWAVQAGERPEKRVPMTRLRKRIAERLLDASQNTAMLTTFNEVNMEPVMRLRKKFGDQFEKRHGGTRLGFMSLFVKASVEALRRYPSVNASIDGEDIVYHGYQDVGVAVSTEKGLVVPVLRNAEQLSLAQIEQQIRDYGLKARDGKLDLEEITGGTFTITNGGVFGSLLSTPILNPPQTAILGMHKIQDRPIAENGQVKIAPMMYLALSYDHRLIDGKEAVQFLVTVKDIIEDPGYLALEL